MASYHEANTQAPICNEGLHHCLDYTFARNTLCSNPGYVLENYTDKLIITFQGTD